MATGKNIRTYYQGEWHDEDVAIMRAADHGSWLGTTVFDGARHFEGVTPDLKEHCVRVNNSARAMMITPTVLEDEMVEIVQEGLKAYSSDAAVYIRPMYWALEGDELAIVPKAGSTGFAICLEEIPMSDLSATSTLTTTSFRRPVLQDNVVNAKAGCLYPNNARMLVEAKSKGFGNALVADFAGNVAETATANIVLNCAFGVKTMPVDTHVYRVSRRLGLSEEKNIVKLELDLLENIPNKWMNYAHHWLILHVRCTCKARKPLCNECLVNHLCNWLFNSKLS